MTRKQGQAGETAKMKGKEMTPIESIKVFARELKRLNIPPEKVISLGYWDEIHFHAIIAMRASEFYSFLEYSTRSSLEIAREILGQISFDLEHRPETTSSALIIENLEQLIIAIKEGEE